MDNLKNDSRLKNKTAEQDVIGLMLLEPEVQTALDTMPISLFTDTEKTIVQGFKEVHGKIENITLIELMEELKKPSYDLDITTLTELTKFVSECTITKYHLNKTLKVLSNLRKKREFVEYAIESIEKLLKGAELESQTIELTNKLERFIQCKNDSINGINNLVQKSMNRLENTDIQTKFGYSLLDKNIGGVKPGDYTIIGAKSGVGKTTLALNIALNVLEQGKKVLIISREMTDVDVFDRFATMVSKIPSMKFRNKDFTADDWKKFVNASGYLGEYEGKLLIDNDSTKISDIIKLVRKHKPDLVVIDYLQLLSAEDGSKLENAERIIANISRNIRTMTLKYDCHVMALVQLNNSFKGMPHGENVIRQSATVYQDATAVIYLHDLEDKEELKFVYSSVGGIGDTEAENIIKNNKSKKSMSVYAFKLDKNRNGATGIEPITFIRPNFKMYDNDGLKNI